MTKSLLIVDDELDIQSSLAFALKDEGYEVFTASSPKEAEAVLSQHAIDIGLFDVWFPEGDGIDLLKLSRSKFPQATLVMMSGHGNIELALKAIRMGAYDFLEKPLELEKVLVVLRNAAEIQNLRLENRRLSSELAGGTDFLGVSAAVKTLRTQIPRAAAAHSHVVIQGENGTGKELVAHLLHDSSSRADRPFVALNCAAIPESLFESELFGHEKGSFTGAIGRSVGRFEQAGQGTLFLDEIGELSPSAQGKLLRVLEERKFERIGGRLSIKFEARLIAATNRDLQAEVKGGRFREDLYFRLNVLAITVPPLRERREDILPLSEFFLRNFAREYARSVPMIKSELSTWLQSYDWPGNVRELRNLIERMFIMGADQSALGVDDLPEELQPADLSSKSAAPIFVKDPLGSLRELRSQFEKSILEQRLEKNYGNVTKTAESLGLERAHLHRKLKAYGIHNVKGDL